MRLASVKWRCGSCGAVVYILWRGWQRLHLGVRIVAFATEAGEAAVRSYARKVASHYASTVSNWVIGNEVNDAIAWDYSGVMDMDEHAVQYAKAFRVF